MLVGSGRPGQLQGESVLALAEGFKDVVAVLAPQPHVLALPPGDVGKDAPPVLVGQEGVARTVEARSQALHAADDDHTKNVFDPSIRGKTDRFALRLRKPR